jgi:hypothetical protein
MYQESVMNTLTSKVATILHSQFPGIVDNIFTNGRTRKLKQH